MTFTTTHPRSRSPIWFGWRALLALLLTTSCGQTDSGGVTGPTPTGDLELSLSGLPVGRAGRLIVIGPNRTDTLTSGRTLSGLRPGQYQVAAEDIDDDDATLLAVPAYQSVAVNAGSTASARVEYRRGAARSGGLTVNVEGLPTGAAGAIAISGPAGFRQQITTTSSAVGIHAGDYLITAEPVVINGATYAPDPASQVIAVAVGDVRVGTVRYLRVSPTTGTLVITSSGLPTGAMAAITISGPGGFAATLTASSQLQNLVPGSYAVSAAEVAVEGARHLPTPASQIVTVSGGEIATAAVTYSPPAAPSGGLSLQVSGLGGATTAAIAVSGPNGYSRLVTSSALLEGLAPGAYVVNAVGILLNGVSYSPLPLSQSVVVVAGGTTVTTVTYSAPSPVLGNLSVAISGLPIPAAASVTVTGADGIPRLLTATTLLEDLAPGSYTIVAAQVMVNGVNQLPLPTSQTAIVTAGTTASATVAYSAAMPATGRLAVDINGLPVGASAAILVTGPNGYSRAVTTAETIEALPIGGYAVAATAVIVGGVTYLPTPTAQAAAITAGVRTVTLITYAPAAPTGPTTGQLNVTVSGVPIPAAAVITVTGPDGFSQTVPTSTSITGLVPGNYTVTASAVTVNSVTYQPTPASQVIAVTVGATAASTVAYAAAPPTTGALTVTPTGLPGGASAAITVSGPNGYSHAVTSTETMSSLPAGTYTVAASTVVVAGVSYLATPATQSVTITAGATSTSSVSYAVAPPTTGQLTVTVAGLPGGTTAAINVTGPNSYTHAVTGSETISALVPGGYTVAAATVTSGSTLYTPSASSQSATVTAGTTVTRTVTYTGTPIAPATITVDTTVRFQRMTGWEATAESGEAETIFAGYQTELMDLAANDLGINRLRLEIASGAENTVDYYAQFRAGTITEQQYNAQRYNWVNDNGSATSMNASGFKWSKLDESIQAAILPMRARLAARGEALYVNLNYVSFGNSTAQQSSAEYAELILATFQHMQSQYGFVPDAVEIILEPDNNTIRTGTGIGNLVATTGARLAAAGFHPDFIAPSVMNMGNTVSYLDQIVAVSGAMTYLTEVAFHRYAGVSDANLSGIKTRAAQLGLRTAMLEHIGSGVEDLYKDLTLGNVSAWQQYTLAYPTNDNGAQYYYINGGRPVMGALTKPLRQYFRYVRSGATRVSATSLNGSVRPVAFTNPGAGMALVLHVDAPGSFTVAGLRVGTYQVEMTNSSGTLISLPSVTVVANGSVTVAPTQSGVLTLYRVP